MSEWVKSQLVEMGHEAPDMLVSFIMLMLSNNKSMTDIKTELVDLIGEEDSAAFTAALEAKLAPPKVEEKKKRGRPKKETTEAGEEEAEEAVKEVSKSERGRSAAADEKEGGGRKGRGANKALKPVSVGNIEPPTGDGGEDHDDDRRGKRGRRNDDREGDRRRDYRDDRHDGRDYRDRRDGGDSRRGRDDYHQRRGNTRSTPGSRGGGMPGINGNIEKMAEMAGFGGDVEGWMAAQQVLMANMMGMGGAMGGFGGAGRGSRGGRGGHDDSRGRGRGRGRGGRSEAPPPALDKASTQYVAPHVVEAQQAAKEEEERLKNEDIAAGKITERTHPAYAEDLTDGHVRGRGRGRGPSRGTGRGTRGRGPYTGRGFSGYTAPRGRGRGSYRGRGSAAFGDDPHAYVKSDMNTGLSSGR